MFEGAHDSVAEALVDALGAGVGGGGVEEGLLAAVKDAGGEFGGDGGAEAAALLVRVCADGTDFGEALGADADSAHGEDAAVLADADVVAEVGRVDGVGTRAGGFDEFQHLRAVIWCEFLEGEAFGVSGG